ncbi:MAG: hypothetical protein JSU61_01195 [Fidelibacterota bacterium]|nr:MAG: hypothetical protein JSU61_01195 [Candidatus Neomarinimicrobiota bacterium]
MKNTSIPIILVLALLWSCEKESTKSEEPDIVGTWEAQTETQYWGSISNPDSTDVTTYGSLATMTWTIESDHDFSSLIYVLGISFTMEGTWTTSGNQLTLNYTVMGIDVTEVYTYEVESDELTITGSLDPADEEGDWVVIVFARQ